MDFGIVLLLAFFGWLAWLMLKSKSSDEQFHCMDCGVDSQPTIRAKGSIWIEVVLWICFIVPGLIYSIWRLSSKRNICPSCDGANLIPYNSPAAVKHRKELSS
ncbi:YqaE/Pmp3 family membrane protein [Rhodoferax sp. TH121]|uniref:YqaE/Pmp3 family membrane protein n=1 Tax=Rhodoferax sp. TH121 TaxID=2022803 RepID=UPI0015956DE2|nr:YqaE/Pmp3 family membrane protein [Rhodoferax sp. TH121]